MHKIINMIWHYLTFNSWSGIKSNLSTNQPRSYWWYFEKDCKDILILTCLGWSYSYKLGNHVYCTFILTYFVQLLLYFYFPYGSVKYYFSKLFLKSFYLSFSEFGQLSSFYCYKYNVSADTTFGLLQVFYIEDGCLQGTFFCRWVHWIWIIFRQIFWPIVLHYGLEKTGL